MPDLVVQILIKIYLFTDLLQIPEQLAALRFKPSIVSRIFCVEDLSIGKYEPDIFCSMIRVHAYTATHAACIIREYSPHHGSTDAGSYMEPWTAVSDTALSIYVAAVVLSDTVNEKKRFRGKLHETR